jgi:hypothetical protein
VAFTEAPESALVSEFRALARAPSSASQFDIDHDGARIRVEYTSGSSSSISMSARYDTHAKDTHVRPGGTAGYRQSARRTLRAPRPMRILLRRESAADKNAKAEGLNREFQTGDASFDDAVYIDSPTTDAELLAEVFGPGVREGAAALIAMGFANVSIDDQDGRVSATLVSFSSAAERDGRAAEMVEAFALVLSGLPAVQPSGAGPKDGLAWPIVFAAAVAGLVGIAAPAAYMAMAAAVGCTVPGSEDGDTNLKPGCCEPGLVALAIAAAAGLVAMRLARAYFKPRISGRSNSAARLSTLSALAFALCAELTFLVASAVALAVR